LKKPKTTQQYVVKRKTAIHTKISAKLKNAQSKSAAQQIRPVKAAQKQKQKTMVLKAPQAVPAAEVIEEKLPPGYKAKLSYDGDGVKVSADIRYETEKTDPLIKIKNIGPKGEIVHREFIGPAKREAWLDENGNEVAKADVQTAQVMPDGSLKPVIVAKTKEIKVEPVDADVPQNFLPYSFLEVWGESDSDADGLRKMGADLMKSGKVGAIKEFSHGYGKMYVGFLRPIMNKDGSKFGIEIMLAENKRSRRRWMLAEAGPSTQKANKPVTPQLW
jgi:hypothetical protein